MNTLKASLLGAAFLVATSFAAVAAETQAPVLAPVQLSEAQMDKVVAGSRAWVGNGGRGNVAVANSGDAYRINPGRGACVNYCP